jgi:hypothetical protein
VNLKFAIKALLILITPFAISCSQSNSSGSEMSGDKQVVSAGSYSPSPMCKRPFNLPETFAKSCSGGSNLPLCAMDSSSQCDSGVCLFDQNGVNGLSAYCTATCDPLSAKSCPNKFACKREGCDKKFVCVRTEGGDQYDRLKTGTESLPPGTNNYVIRQVASNSKGDHLVVTSGSQVLLRQSSGEWTALHLTQPFLAKMYFSKISVIDDVFYLHKATPFANVDFRSVYRIDGKNAALVPMPSSNVGQICDGNKGQGCQGDVYQLWKTKEGDLGVIISGYSKYAAYKKIGEKWMEQKLAPELLNLAVTGERMNDNTYVSEGSRNGRPMVFFSEDLMEWTAIAVPPEASIKSTLRNLVGFQKNDIWIFDEAGAIFRWNGTAWFKENITASYTSSVIKIQEQQYVVLGYGGMALQNSCWRQIENLPSPETAFALNGRLASLYDGEVTLYDNMFVPEY